MGDIALVPQGDVFHGRNCVAAHKPGKSGQVLGENRVALVRHGGRTLLTFREEFLGLQHFGALQVPDFRGDPLNGGRDHAKRCKIHRMPVARDDLR